MEAARSSFISFSVLKTGPSSNRHRGRGEERTNAPSNDAAGGRSRINRSNVGGSITGLTCFSRCRCPSGGGCGFTARSCFQDGGGDGLRYRSLSRSSRKWSSGRGRLCSFSRLRSAGGRGRLFKFGMARSAAFAGPFMAERGMDGVSSRSRLTEATSFLARATPRSCSAIASMELLVCRGAKRLIRASTGERLEPGRACC